MSESGLGAPKALLGSVIALGFAKWALFTGLGFDPVWIGVIMVVRLEIGFLTPPVELNLFVIQGLMPGTGAREVTVGITRYVLLMILLVVILFVFPDLALWLPSQMMPGRR